ncbi:MAG: cyclophilin-like family protein [Thermoproteota archaeon]
MLAYSPVNVFGRVLDDYNVLKKVKDGEKVRVYKP